MSRQARAQSYPDIQDASTARVSHKRGTLRRLSCAYSLNSRPENERDWFLRIGAISGPGMRDSARTPPSAAANRRPRCAWTAHQLWVASVAVWKTRATPTRANFGREMRTLGSHTSFFFGEVGGRNRLSERETKEPSFRGLNKTRNQFKAQAAHPLPICSTEHSVSSCPPSGCRRIASVARLVDR